MFKIGYRVRITAIPPGVITILDDDGYPQMDTRGVFRECLGLPFRVRGFDKYGNLELWVHGRDDDHPQAYLESIWVEPEFVEAVADIEGRP